MNPERKTPTRIGKFSPLEVSMALKKDGKGNYSPPPLPRQLVGGARKKKPPSENHAEKERSPPPPPPPLLTFPKKHPGQKKKI